VHGGSARVERGRRPSPELVLRGDPAPLVAAVTGTDPHPAGVELEGDAAALDRLRSMVALPGAAADAVDALDDRLPAAAG
jgi:hypothetical protein